MLTSLSHLDLSGNHKLAGGWQHLLPLRQLNSLDLRYCGLSEVRQELAELRAVIALYASDFI